MFHGQPSRPAAKLARLDQVPHPLHTYLSARRPKMMPASGPRLMVVRATRRAGDSSVRGRRRRAGTRLLRAKYTAACEHATLGSRSSIAIVCRTCVVAVVITSAAQSQRCEWHPCEGGAWHRTSHVNLRLCRFEVTQKVPAAIASPSPRATVRDFPQHRAGRAGAVRRLNIGLSGRRTLR